MSDAGATPQSAGWWPDPYKRFEQRYFDGTLWSEHVFSDGLQSTSPPPIIPPPPPPTISPPPGRARSSGRTALFRRPLLSDPIFWVGSVLAVLGFVAAIVGGSVNTSADGSSDAFAVVDGVLGAGLWFLLGGMLPAAVRKRFRRPT